MAMPMEKVSVTLGGDTLKEIRERVGKRGVSSFIEDSVQLRLQHDRIRRFLRQLDEEFGPVPPEIKEEVDREWNATRPKLKKPRRPR